MKNYLFLALVAALSLASCKQKSQLPFVENFESSHYPPDGWVQFPIDSSNYWLRDTTVSAYGVGNACISYNNLAPTSVYGTYRGIRMPFMNFVGVTNPYLRFDIAYAQRETLPEAPADSSAIDSLTANTPILVTDTFGIWWSLGNDSTHWNNIQNWGGIGLATAPPTVGVFTPNPSQWKTVTLSVKAVAGLESFRLGLENDCYKGNKIYFDNVLIFDSVEVAK